MIPVSGVTYASQLVHWCFHSVSSEYYPTYMQVRPF